MKMRLIKPSGAVRPATPLKRKACTPCRTRKVKCDRGSPCGTCSRWLIECRYPSPQRTCRRDPKDDSATKLERKRAPFTNAEPAPSPGPFPFATFRLDVAPFHPAPAQLAVYQRVFFENIDPLIKVLHRPSVEVLLQRAARDPTALGDGESAVAFAIYYASLSSMTDQDAEGCCFHLSSGSRRAAMAAYKGAAEHALARADLLLAAADNLTTLQAFVLCLSLDMFTDDGGRRAWALIGLASRLLHDDASSTFEAEMRRRIHWKLWYLDQRARADVGRGGGGSTTATAAAAITELLIPPRPAANVADADLDPSMTTLPEEPLRGWTEASFSLMQFEIAATACVMRMQRQQQPKEQERDASGTEVLITDCESGVWVRYLLHCDGSAPVHWLARHVGHVLLMELRFQNDDVSNTSAAPLLSTPHQQQLFQTAVDILDTQRRVRDEPEARRWSWLLAGYMQFWPLSFVLRRFCQYYWYFHHHSGTSLESDLDLPRAWEVAERSFARWGLSVSGTGSLRVGASSHTETLHHLMDQARVARNGTWEWISMALGAGARVDACAAPYGGSPRVAERC